MVTAKRAIRILLGGVSLLAQTNAPPAEPNWSAVAPIKGTAKKQVGPLEVLTDTGIPAYPRLAEQARIEGTVKVGITVDETGTVIKATGISGQPMLQAAAVENIKTFRPNEGKII